MVIAIIIVALTLILVSFLNFKPKTGGDVPFDVDGSGKIEGSSADGGDDIEPVKPTVSGGTVDGYTRTNTDKYNFLVLGRDRVALNTDVFMLVSFDTKTGEIAVMQIPRDTMIRIYGDTIRINSLYATMYSNAVSSGLSSEEAQKKGMEDSVAFLQTNLNIKIDYWALCNLDGFVKIIDIIGGVEMDVPFDMDYEDPYQDLYIHLKAGLQVLDGEQCEQFVRFRHGYVEADVGRVNAQKLFLTALMKQLKTSLTITKIPSLAKAMVENVLTDMSAAEIAYFAKEALGADLSSLELLTIPGEAAREYGDSGRWLFFLYRADTLSVINMYFNVYDSDISDSIFDSSQTFNIPSRSYIDSIYNRAPSEDIVSDYVTSGKQADEQGIDIPLT